jgi:hypothetical protein
MTTREIYFKVLIHADLPHGILLYTTDDGEKIQIGNSVCLELRTNEEIVLKNIEIMKNIENQPNFKFWNISPVGESFLKKLKNARFFDR